MRSPAILAICIVLRAPATEAQGSIFAGRVLTDSGLVLAGAEVLLNGPQTLQRTNDKGEFRFTAVPAGFHVIGVRMPGYTQKVDTIEVADAGEIQRVYRLSKADAALPEVAVTATSTSLNRMLSEFNERRRIGIGRFLDSAEFWKMRGIRMSDRLRQLPGITVLRGRFSDAYIANSRVSGGRCRAAIWVDRVNMGTNYNVNLLDPSMIAAVEWYAGQASIPAQFNVPQRAGQEFCGVLVIWIR